MNDYVAWYAPAGFRRGTIPKVPVDDRKTEKNLIDECLISWLIDQDNIDTPLIVRGQESFSASQLIHELKTNSEVGIELRENIIKLTIESFLTEKNITTYTEDFEQHY